MRSKIKYQIEPEQNLILANAKGEMEINEFNIHLEDLLEDPDFDPGLFGLYDFTEIVKLTGSVQAFEQTSETITEMPFEGKKAKVAIVIGPDDLLQRMFHAWRIMMSYSPVEYQVFNSIESANNWLYPEEPSSE